MDPAHSEAPEIQPELPEAQPIQLSPESSLQLEAAPVAAAAAQPWETRILLQILMGKQGLRAGWSVALFVILAGIFGGIAGFAFVQLHLIDQKA